MTEDKENNIGRGNTDCLFVIDELPFYVPPYTRRIHPKRNRQRNPNRKRIKNSKINRDLRLFSIVENWKDKLNKANS